MSSKPRSGAAATPAARRARAMRWAIGVGAALVTAIGLVLMFLLAQATNNRALYERYYVRLFGINVVVAVLLAVPLPLTRPAPLEFGGGTDAVRMPAGSK